VFCAGVGPQQVRMAVRFANLGVTCPATPATCTVTTTDVDPPFFSVLLASAPGSG
jgi:hypothetical protein